MKFTKKSKVPTTSQGYTAFTLAEVLITLGIIGVVAAMTIPSLVRKYEIKQFKSAWKKEYSAITSAYNLIKADNNGTIKDICPKVGWIEDSKCLMDLFAIKLKAQKVCANSIGCWHTSPLPKTLSGAEQSLNGSVYPSMITNDGSLMKFHAGNSDCSVAATTDENGVCVQLAIDTNGFKPPNVIGKDIQLLYLLPKTFRFVNGAQDCNLDPPSGQGYGCAALFLME